MKHVYQTFLVLVILVTAVIAGAGAINYFAKGAGVIYLIAGIINIIGGVFLAYKTATNVKYEESKQQHNNKK